MNFSRLPKTTRAHLRSHNEFADGIQELEFDFWDINGHTLRDQIARAGGDMRLFHVECEDGQPVGIYVRYHERDE